MSKKQPKTEETIDERLYRELGVIPVSQDHPIYSRGHSIRFISKKNKWGSCMQGGVIPIPKEDFNLITKEMKK